MKTVLITGANKGIGFEIARELGAKGFCVVLSGRVKDRVEQAVRSLVSDGIEAIPLVMDVGNVKSIREAYDSLNSTHKEPLDVLINNAGVLLGEYNDLLQMTEVEVLDTFRINAFGPLWVIQQFLPMMQRGARIINISSSAGSITKGASGYAPLYSSSKTLENAFTIHLAASLKSKGIVINAVCPGWVRTDMGGSGASRSVAKGAETPVWLATEAPLSLTGKFLRDKKEIAW